MLLYTYATIKARNQTEPLSQTTCIPIPPAYYEAEPISGNWVLHHILTVAAAPLVLSTTLVTLFIVGRHLATYTNPDIQRQLIRVILVPLCFGVFGFFSLWFYDAAEYLPSISDLYECFALVAFFCHIISLATPDEKLRLWFFHALENKTRRGKIIPGGSLKWLAIRWVMVFQVLPGRVITTIATWIITATFCQTGTPYRTALIIIQVIDSVQTSVCVVGLLQTCVRLREYLLGSGVLNRFISFKVVVFVQMIQCILFTALTSSKVNKPSKYASAADWSRGIPQFFTIVEMLFFVFIFLATFSWKRFKAQKETPQDTVRLSFGRALLDVLNVGDIASGILYPVHIMRVKKEMQFSGAKQEHEPLRET